MLDNKILKEHTLSTRIVYHAGMMIDCQTMEINDEFSHEEKTIGDIRIKKNHFMLEIFIAGKIVFKASEEGYHHFSPIESRPWTQEVFSAASELARVELPHAQHLSNK